MEDSTTVNVNRRFAAFTLLWSTAALVLLCLTWRLWTGTSDFPQVPVFSPMVGWPLAVDWLLLAAMVFSCVVIVSNCVQFLIRRPAGSAAFGMTETSTLEAGLIKNSQLPLPFFNRLSLVACVFTATLLSLFLLNQHRLQPWAWQFALYALITVMAGRLHPPIDAKARIDRHQSIHNDGVLNGIFAARWLTASIYFHSALGKFDYQFIHGLGSRLANAGTELIGFDAMNLPVQAAVVMPVFELLISIFLITRPLRKWGVAMAIVFHISLLATLGPWGLGHHTGVLAWNVFFMAITVVLFRPISQIGQRSTSRPVSFRTKFLSAMLVLYPLLPNCDHWLAWGLYSPNNSRTDLEVIRQDKAGVSRFERFSLSDQSLQKLNVPLYPEARFQLGVATAIKQSGQLKTPSRIIVRSRSDRFTGQRDSSEFKSESWQPAPTDFLLNWRPRFDAAR